MIRGPRVYAVVVVAAVVVVVAASLCGCIAIADFGDYDITRAADEAGAPEAGAALSIASVAPVAVYRGKSVTFAVTVDRGGERAPLNVEMSSLPAGVTVPRVVLPAGAGTGTATLTMATTSEVALGDFTAVVRASATAGASSATSIVMVGVRTTQLEPTFGEGGFVIGPVNETVEDFACAADGTTFVAVTGLQDNNPRLAGRFLIHRLAATGAVDTFLDRAGNAGDHRLGISPRGELVMTSALTSSAKVEGYSLTSRELVWSTALDPLTATAIARPAIATDGTIFVVSSGVNAGGRGVVYVRRLSAQGTDPSVGAGAIRLPQSASSSNEMRAGAARLIGGPLLQGACQARVSG